jgi:hypothetical protein
MFVACSYRGAYRGGIFVDNIGIVEADQEEGGGRWLSMSGRGALALLEDAIVWDDGTTAATREFTAKTKAYVLKTMIDEAQARGGLTALAYDFTATDDSDSVAWTDSGDYSLTVGATLLDIIRQFTKTGTEFSISFAAGTFTLSAYQTEIGSDKSATVFFRTGGNCEQISRDQRGGDIANALRVAYKSGSVTATDATSITAYRRREKALDARLAQSLTSASSYASAQLAVTKDPQLSIAVKVYDGVQPNLFLDYILGDYVTLDIFGAEYTYRVLGLQCDFDGVAYSNVVVEMNTILRDAQLDIEERLEWLTQQWELADEAGELETSTWGKFTGSANSGQITLNCDGQVYALYLEGDNLYVGGNFETIGNLTVANGFASVNIKTGVWNAYAGTGNYIGITQNSGATNGTCFAITGNNTGVIYLTGAFDNAGDTACSGIAKLTVATLAFSALGAGLKNGSGTTDGYGYALAIDGSGNVWVAGEYDTAGGVATESLAYWNGAAFIGDPDDLITIGFSRQIWALAIDSNNNIYAGGDFTAGAAAKFSRIAMLNAGTSTWESLDTGIGAGIVYALAVNSSDQLYVGGDFTNAGGVAAADRIALWTGSTWSALGTGFSAGTVYVLHVDTFGNLYLGGAGLSTIDGITTNDLARYSGGRWYSVGTEPNTGTDGDVTALETSATGDVYVGGYFYRAGDIEADPDGNGLHLAAFLTTFQAVIDYINAGAGYGGAFHAPVTIGTARGLSIVADTQVLSLALASTSSAGAVLQATAPAANELNVVGITNGETAYANKDLFNTTSPANLGVAAAGTAIQASRSDHVHSMLKPYIAKTADYTLTTTDYTVNVTANSVNITLPTAVGFAGQVYNIKNSGTGVITLLTTSSQTIDGGASGSITLDQYENLTVQSDGANWMIL